MKVPISLKSLDDGRESLDIEVEVDHAHHLVTLRLREFDGPHVASFLAQALPNEFGVRVGKAVATDTSLPRYGLVVALAGRNHPARLQHLSSGDFSIRLGDPDDALSAALHLPQICHREGAAPRLESTGQAGSPAEWGESMKPLILSDPHLELGTSLTLPPSLEFPIDSSLAPMERRALLDADVRHGFDHYDELVTETEPGRHEALLAEREDMVALAEAARLVGGTVLTGVSIGRLGRWSALRHPRVIALSHPRLGPRFPRWQFERGIWPVVQGLALALDATSAVALLSWLETPHGALDGRTPRAALEQGELAERVLALAAGDGL